MQCLANAIENNTDPQACRTMADYDNQAVNSQIMKCLSEAVENETDPMLCRVYSEPQPTEDQKLAAGAVMCLTRLMMAATKPAQCTKYVSHYLSIADYDAGIFDPDDTYEERGEFLDKCQKCKRRDKQRVQLNYGHLPPSANI